LPKRKKEVPKIYELSVLKSFLDKETYQKYRSFVDDKKISPELRPVFKGMDEWYTTNVGSPALEDVANLTFANGVPEKDVEYTKSVFNTLQSINGHESVQKLLESFKTQKVLGDIAFAAYEASEGRKQATDVLELVDQLKNPQIVQFEYVTTNVRDILQKTIHAPGLRWRLDSLNKSLGSLRKGNFGFVFARPETGKTTFLASEVTNMASQLNEESGPIIWINNEEQGESVMQRIMQASLGCKVEHLEKAPDRANEAFEKNTHGKLKLLDRAGIHKREVEAVFHNERPSLVLFDQIDKIKGFKADRKDLAMGDIYQWARELAKEYCPIIGVCQADVSGENQRWLYMDNVADAKTAKQAEADFIIGIGKIHDQGFEDIRFINISKNKLPGDPDTDRANRHPQIQVQINPQIARYNDL
jgi:KaiC/GvpD/RAD55 family RecA-like ATPase